MTAPIATSDRAAALRAQFDRSFAEPRHQDATQRENFLGIRLGDAPYALRLTDIAGVFTDKKITRIPGPHPALFGIAGFRGAILPVYSLCAIAGFPFSGTSRWLALSSVLPIAWTFTGFDGYLRRDRAQVAGDAPARADGLRPSGFIREYLLPDMATDPVVRPIMDLKALAESIAGPSAGPHFDTGAAHDV